MRDLLDELHALTDRLIERDKQQQQWRAIYQGIVEHSPHGIYLLDVETRTVVMSNASFRKMLGYDSDGVSGLPVYDLLDHTREDIDARIEAVLREGHIAHGERRYRCLDGSVVELEVYAAAAELGGRKAIFTIAKPTGET